MLILSDDASSHPILHRGLLYTPVLLRQGYNDHDGVVDDAGEIIPAPVPGLTGVVTALAYGNRINVDAAYVGTRAKDPNNPNTLREIFVRSSPPPRDGTADPGFARTDFH